MQYDFGEVSAEACSTSVSIAVVGERRQLDRLPVVVPAVRDGRVEHRLQRGYGFGSSTSTIGVPNSFSGPHHLDPVLGRAGVAGADHHDRLAVHVLGQERQRRREPQVEDRRQLVGRRGDELAVEAQHLAGVLERVEDRPGQHDRPDRVQPVLERGDDAEVAAAAADAPEQVGVLSSLAVTSSPSAVTRSTESRLSTVAPCLRMSQPMPPPSVRPAIPVWVTIPPTVASP